MSDMGTAENIYRKAQAGITGRVEDGKLIIEPQKMVCSSVWPRCIVCGELSQPTGGVETTLVGSTPWVDDNGVRHHHDGNRLNALCGCPNGHKQSVQTGNKCGCGWTSGYAKARSAKLRTEKVPSE